MRSILTAALLVAAFAFPLVPVAAQDAPPEFPPGFKGCGAVDELVLVFMNPDLSKPDENDIIHATGRFFIQFQARGPKAMDIDTLYFSFGKWTGTGDTCDAAAATPTRGVTDGALIQNFRADFDWKDGFFVPINTYNVPDGDYLAALSAYDAAGNEIVRYWAHAVVENGCSEAQMPCSTKEESLRGTDKVMPWPMILPGDGDRFDGKDGLYVEIAEPVAEIKAYLGTHEGQKVIELTEIPAPNRDDDLVPDVAAGGQKKQNTLDCGAQSTTQCAKPYGQAWEWPGVIGDEAVIRVRAVDLNGNVAEKVVHVGDPTIGGRVSAGLPELEFELPDGDSAETDVNGRALWQVVYKSLNDDGVHGDVFVRNPDGTLIDSKFRARLTPNHVMMGGKEQRNGTVEIIAGPEVTPGTYDFHLVVNYLAASERIEKSTPLKLVVADRSSDLDAEEQTASEAGEQVESTRGEDLVLSNATVVVPEEIPKETPGLAAVAAVAALAGVAVLARRRK